ncbi:MAG: hypothetical protein JWL70_179 [Acidimicrobiia bacterium]|nr:hypothetical protein [Acidimicrobiia bacterium]
MSSYVGISPPRARQFAALLREAASEASARGVAMSGLLHDAQLTSAGPAMATDVDLTMSMAASVLEQRATIADLCHTDPGALGDNLKASEDALWRYLFDDQGVNLLDPALVKPVMPSDPGVGSSAIIDRLWELMGTASDVSSLDAELLNAMKFGIVLKIQMAAGAGGVAKLLEYLGPLAQSPQGRRLIEFLAVQPAGASALFGELLSLSDTFKAVFTRGPATSLGKWFQETYPGLYETTTGTGRGADAFFAGMELWQAIEAGVDFRFDDATRHGLGAAAGILLLSTNPALLAAGAILLTGLLIYDNGDWIKRNLSKTGLIHVGETIASGVMDGAIDVKDSIVEGAESLKESFTGGLLHPLGR